MRHALVVVMALVGLGACSETPVSPRNPPPDGIGGPELAAVVSTTNDVEVAAITTFVPCANGGAGEVVQAVGRIHRLMTSVVNPTGTVTVKTHSQPQGLTAIGLTTGDKYQATGVTQETDVFVAPFPFIAAFTNNFRFIGPGPDNNLLIHEEFHITINANGTFTVSNDHFSVECR
ncbi:MAG TPA: hypothetical protein VFW03_10620 [Gemmatimonadaceae bacterium]|nr:hypothetical protein [Gemmatimonadaceae bacterium]